MPAPSLSERFEVFRREMVTVRDIVIREEAASRFNGEAIVLNQGELRKSIDKLAEKITALETKSNELYVRLAAFEERIKSLEKHSDRHWQVWLALGSAITALLVAFLKK